MIRSFMDGLLDLVYPPICTICRHHPVTNPVYTGVCHSCAKALPLSRPPFCLTCSRPLSAPVEHPRCLNCRKYHPHFDFAWGAAPYHDHLRRMIHRFKYHQKIYYRFIMAEMMCAYLQRYQLDIQQFDGLIPIPLSATRQRERGYNQAELLARELEKRLRIRCLSNVLVRKRHTPTQTSLSRKERWTNIEGAFRIKSSKRLNQKNILLIDDLLTTGATASAAAHIIKEETDASTVAVFTLAIA